MSSRVSPQTSLATARDQHIEDALDGPAVVGAGASGVSWGREQWLDEGPLPLRAMNPVHAGMLGHPATVSEPPLCGWTPEQ
jgi:hypothetical protein